VAPVISVLDFLDVTDFSSLTLVRRRLFLLVTKTNPSSSDSLAQYGQFPELTTSA
jgi:hypothetical protein